jgi:hypothetical protein
MDAFRNYKNMDNMIAYMNANYADKYEFKYSTPSNYVDALASLNVTWPTKYDDLFPYQDNPSSFWTGYFSSRANAKGYVRAGSANLRATSQLYTDAVLTQDFDQKVLNEMLAARDNLWDQMAIF